MPKKQNPDGLSGKKSKGPSIFKIYTRKLNKLARRQKAIRENGKVLRIPRGTARAVRREGLVQGWRALADKGQAVKTMLPAKGSADWFDDRRYAAYDARKGC